MTEDDAQTFMDAWDQMSMMLAGKSIPDAGLALVFSVLSDYPLDRVLKSMEIHAKQSKWMPAPSEIIDIITGRADAPEITDQYLIDLAIAADTPLGVITRSYLTSWTLTTATPYEIRDRMKAVRHRVDRFITEAQRGEYSTEVMRVLSHQGFADPRHALAHGVPSMHSIAGEEPPRQLEQSNATEGLPAANPERVRQLVANAATITHQTVN